jgi:hypothetical protein
MLGRGQTPRAERRTHDGALLPGFDQFGPSPVLTDLVAQIEAWTRPGDIVLDLNGRGGWVAWAALAGQRAAADYETTSLTRLLADVVLRPPDAGQIEAAVAAIAGKTLGQASVKDAIEALFATTCPVCGRATTLESLDWEVADDGSERPIRREFECPACQRQLGGPRLRHAEPAPDDVARAAYADLPAGLRDGLRKRFPTPDPDDRLPDQLLDLHTPRQLFGLAAILEAIELEIRPVPVSAALRLALLRAVESACRLNHPHGKPAGLRLARGAVKQPDHRAWREVSPWSAFAEAAKAIARFVEILGADPSRPVVLRPVTDLGELHEGISNVALAESTPGSMRRLAMTGERLAASRAPSRVRLVLGQLPVHPTRDKLAALYRDTAWALGAGAASMLPYEELGRHSRDDRSSAADETARGLARSLAVATTVLAPNGRAVILLDDAEPAALVATALGAAAAGYRLADARLVRAEGGQPIAVVVPPTGTIGPGPRTRANLPLPPVEGGAGHPGTIAGRGVFGAPESLEGGPFRASAAASDVRDTAVEALKARGEPARFEQLLGDLLVGLDRCGQLARFAARLRPSGADSGWQAWLDSSTSAGTTSAAASPTTSGPTTAAPPEPNASPAGLVDELLAILRDELDRATNRRVRQIEPGLYWLTADEDLGSTAQPLADRVEWAVFSLLASAQEVDRSAAVGRIVSLFAAHDSPDGELLTACLDSYAVPGTTPDAIATADRLERRLAEHDAMIATIADLGHRLGARAWIGRRQQSHRVGDHHLADWLEPEELDVEPATIAWGPQEELERVDCAWYSRQGNSYLFEVEWTAMLGDAVLQRHARFPVDDRVVRFLVIPGERASLVRHKLASSPLLRQEFAARNWHVLRWDRLAEFVARDEVSLAGLEPYVGLDATALGGEQMALPAAGLAEEVT